MTETTIPLFRVIFDALHNFTDYNIHYQINSLSVTIVTTPQ